MICLSAFARNVAWLCLLLSITACNSKLFIPADTSIRIDPARLVIQLDSNMRKNDCYPVVIGLRDLTGNIPVPAWQNTPVTVRAAATQTVYGTLRGCELEDAADEREQVFAATGETEVTAYVRSTETGSLKISALLSSNPTVAVEKNVVVTFSRFNMVRGPDDYILSSAYDATAQRWYVIGPFTAFDDIYVYGVARINADGTLDKTFAATGTGLSGTMICVAVQADGKILVGGNLSSYNGIPLGRIARLNIDGSLDTTFNTTGTGFGATVNTITVQGDGKILVGGGFTSYDATTRRYIARLNADGSLDGSFAQTGTGLNGMVSAIKVQADGKVVVGGHFTSYNGASRIFAARLNDDGTLDNSFVHTGTGLSHNIQTLALQADGKIVIGGPFSSYNGSQRNRVARLNSDGSLDTSFVHTGTGLNNTVYSLAIQPDGKIVVSGSFINYNSVNRGLVARLNSDGTLDTSFALSGNGFTSTAAVAYSVDLQADGRVLLSGSFISHDGVGRPRFARLNTDGSLDTSYGPMMYGFNTPTLRTARLLSDGKILIIGQFTSFNGVTRSYIARMNEDGTLDSSFSQTGTGLNFYPSAMVLQPDGKILVAGGFLSYNGISRPSVARLNSDGTLDTTFVQTGTGFNQQANALALQSDGKILVGGNFTNYNSVTRYYVARLNTDGSLDTSFVHTGTGLANSVTALAVQPDGKVLVGGTFTSYNGTARPYIARLLSDGSLDTSFATEGTGFNASITNILVGADGKVTLAGVFSTYNGSNLSRIARLNSNGTQDTSFAHTAVLNSSASGLAIQVDGKILLGGSFTTYNGAPCRYIARFNPDGSLDSSFAPTGDGYSGTVVGITILPNQKLFTVGGFTRYDSYTAPYFNRLTSTGQLD